MEVRQTKRGIRFEAEKTESETPARENEILEKHRNSIGFNSVPGFLSPEKKPFREAIKTRVERQHAKWDHCLRSNL